MNEHVILAMSGAPDYEQKDLQSNEKHACMNEHVILAMSGAPDYEQKELQSNEKHKTDI